MKYLDIASIVGNVLFLVIILMQKRKINILRRSILNVDREEVDLISGDGLFDNLTKAKKLAKELKVKIHPDQFALDSTKVVAESLFQQVAANSTNFQLLKETETKINSFLNEHHSER